MKLKIHVSAAVFLLGCALGAAAPRKETELAPEEARQLQQDKVLITGRIYKQIFTPYIFSPMPVFITTDLPEGCMKDDSHAICAAVHTMKGLMLQSSCGTPKNQRRLG